MVSVRPDSWVGLLARRFGMSSAPLLSTGWVPTSDVLPYRPSDTTLARTHAALGIDLLSVGACRCSHQAPAATPSTTPGRGQFMTKSLIVIAEGDDGLRRSVTELAP